MALPPESMPAEPPAAIPQQAAPPPPPPPPKFYNVKVRTRTSYGCAKVMAVPPEEFGVSSRARCIKDADYACHVKPWAVHELLSAGFDPDQVSGLPTYPGSHYSTEVDARDSENQAEFQRSADTINEMSRQIDVTEHYMRMDYDGSGAKLYKITTATEGFEILRRRDDEGGPYEDDIEEVDVMPFAGITPMTIPHRIIGRSIADLVMEDQKIKTAIKRALLDNTYLSVNPRPIVAESGMTDNTLDDLLTWRPGAPIRARSADAVVFTQVPSVGNIIYPLLDRLDYELEARTGFSKNQGMDPNVLQNMPATNANLMSNAAQQRIKLIARIFAETGIRDMFLLLHQVIRKNDRIENTVRLRGEWVTVDPRQWKTRSDMTVNVGLGTGSKDQQLLGLASLGMDLEKIIQRPELNMVGRQNVYEYMKEKCKLLGYKNVERFVQNPATTQPGQPPPDPKVQIEQQKMQVEVMKAQLQDQREKTQAQADIATQQFKVQSELQLKREEFQHKANLEVLSHGLEMDVKRQEAAQKTQERAEMHQQRLQQQAEMHKAGLAGDAQDRGNLATAIGRMEQAFSRPRKLVRHPKTGRVEGLN